MHRTTNVRYFAVAALFAGFGIVAIFSVGALFLFTGVLMFLVAPLRRRRALFWAVVPIPLLFSVGYLSVAPLGCSTTVTSVGASASTQKTSCSAIFGEYNSRPSLAPALAIGLLAATIGSALIYLLISRSHPRGHLETPGDRSL